MATVHDAHSLMPDRLLPRFAAFADALDAGSYMAGPFNGDGDADPTLLRAGLRMETTVLRTFATADDVLRAVNDEFGARLADLETRVGEADAGVRDEFDRLRQEVVVAKQQGGTAGDTLQAAQQEIAALKDETARQQSRIKDCVESLSGAEADIARLQEQRSALEQRLTAENGRAVELDNDEQAQRVEETRQEQVALTELENQRSAAKEFKQYETQRTKRTADRRKEVEGARKAADEILRKNDAGAASDADASAARSVFASASERLQDTGKGLAAEADARTGDPESAHTQGLLAEAVEYERAATDMDAESARVEQRAASVPSAHSRQTAFAVFWRALLTDAGQKKFDAFKDRLWKGEGFNFEHAEALAVRSGGSLDKALAVVRDAWMQHVDVRSQDLAGRTTTAFQTAPRPTIAEVSTAVKNVLRTASPSSLARGTTLARAVGALMATDLALERIFQDEQQRVTEDGGWFTEDDWTLVARMHQHIEEQQQQQHP